MVCPKAYNAFTPSSEEVLHAPPYPGVGTGTSTYSEVCERSDRFHSSVSTVVALLVTCYQVKSKSVLEHHAHLEQSASHD